MLKEWLPGDFWDAYKGAVYKSPIPAGQEKECSNAFFAGMYAAWEFQMEVAVELGEDEAVEALGRFNEALWVIALAGNGDYLMKKKTIL